MVGKDLIGSALGFAKTRGRRAAVRRAYDAAAFLVSLLFLILVLAHIWHAGLWVAVYAFNVGALGERIFGAAPRAPERGGRAS